jgi:transcriptional regulator with XRE-family HTH domain
MAHRLRRYRGKPPRRRRWDSFDLDLPFEFNQPLERYRLHHRMRLTAFADFLGVTEPLYLRLVSGDRDVSTVIKHQIARRLRVPPWLINECVPPPTEGQLAQLAAYYKEAGEQAFIAVDPETGQPTGEIFFEDKDGELRPGLKLLSEPERLADAYYKLTRVHRDGEDPDYPTVRAHLEHRIQQVIGINAGEPFDYLAWAREGIGIPSWFVEPEDAPQG